MLTLRQRKPGGPWHVRGTVRVGKKIHKVAEHSTGQRNRSAAMMYVQKIQTEVSHELLCPAKPPAAAKIDMRKVYFLRALDGRVKIGVTKDVIRRRWILQSAHGDPLEVMATLPGGRPVEKALHAVFEMYRAHGEWFRLPEEVIKAIRLLRPTPESGQSKAEPPRDAPELCVDGDNVVPLQGLAFGERSMP